MAGEVDARLASLGIEIPEAAAPVANYVGHLRTGNLVFISGQVPLVDGAFKFQGKVGAEFSVEEGQEAARICAINIIAQLKAACGGLPSMAAIWNCTLGAVARSSRSRAPPSGRGRPVCTVSVPRGVCSWNRPWPRRAETTAAKRAPGRSRVSWAEGSSTVSVGPGPGAGAGGGVVGGGGGVTLDMFR